MEYSCKGFPSGLRNRVGLRLRGRRGASLILDGGGFCEKGEKKLSRRGERGKKKPEVTVKKYGDLQGTWGE